MKKREKIILLSLAGLFLIIMVGVLLQRHISSKRNLVIQLKTANSDTVRARIFYQAGEKIKISNPDSAIHYYNKAIHLTASLPKDSSVIHLLASSYIGLGVALSDKGNYKEALKNDSIALQMVTRTNDKYVISQALNNIGIVYGNQGDYSQALVHYLQALAIAKGINAKQLQAKYFTNIAVVQHIQGKIKEAISNFNKTIALAEELHDSTLLAGSLINTGVVYYNYGDYPKAISQFQKALHTDQMLGEKNGMVLCNQNLGDVYFDMGNYPQAIEFYNTSLQLAVAMGDKLNISKAYQNLGETYSRIGDYENAMTQYIKSARIKEDLGAKQGLAATYSALGALHYQNKNYKKASYYFELGLKLNQEMNYVQGMATAYCNIASIYGAQNKTNDAINYYLKAKQLDEGIALKGSLADVLINLGSQYQQIKNYAEAEKYYLQALQINKTLSNKEGIAISYYELADMYDDKARLQKAGTTVLFQKAVDYGIKAYKTGKEIKALPIINKAANVLKQAYKGLGDYTKASEFAEIYITTNDSIFNKSKIEAQTFAEARWSAEKKQAQIEVLESQKRLNQEMIYRQRAEAQKQKVILYATLFILLFAVIASVLVIGNIRKRRDILYQKQLVNVANLRMQNTRNRISPHFLFNALSSLSGSTDNSGYLREKLNKISFLLRKSLENIETIAIPLSEEMDVVRAYIELQKERIPGQLDVIFEIDESTDPQQLIPAMIIQIPVENAIKHGLLPLEQPYKRLLIHINHNETGHQIIIEDNGVGISAASGRTEGTGTGLKVLMQTIHLLNSKNKNTITFSMREKGPGETNAPGTIVEIFIPASYTFSFGN